MKNCTIKNSELLMLFNMVEKYKTANKPISWAFKEFAKKTNRQQNSIRNLYYMQLSVLCSNKEKAKELGIDLSRHSVQNPLPFSPEEENDMFKKIQDLTGKGYSVRKSCMILANGDPSLMIRYQNKYRCMLNQNKNDDFNVIKMPPKKIGITDADIQSLFLGLVKLVKRNALVEAKSQTEESAKRNEVLIDKYLIDLNSKAEEIDSLKQQVALFSEMNKNLQAEVNCLKKKQQPNQKQPANKKLKSFLQKASQNLVNAATPEKA